MDEALEARIAWEQSSGAWIDCASKADTNRTHLLDPVMLDCIGDVAGLEVADIGCGEGRFCRMLSHLGARVTGLDLTPALVTEASRLDPNGQYIAANAERLPLPSDAFDVVVSYIVLVDVPDFRAAIREMARVTKPGGRLVVAGISSFASTTATGWHRDADGNKLHFPVDRYFDERPLRLSWSGISVLNWHRPLEAYMSAYLGAGLVLEQFLEPIPTPEAVAAHPKMADQLRVPLFNVMVWRRPA